MLEGNNNLNIEYRYYLHTSDYTAYVIVVVKCGCDVLWCLLCVCLCYDMCCIVSGTCQALSRMKYNVFKSRKK